MRVALFGRNVITAHRTLARGRGDVSLEAKIGGGPAGVNAGATHGLGILGYNTESKRYTYYSIDNSGMSGPVAYGDLAGDTWTWTTEDTMNGQQVKSHFTIKQVSQDSYTWTWEMAMGGGPFAVMATGTDTRVR